MRGVPGGRRPSRITFWIIPLVLVTLIWGNSFIAIKHVVAYVAPLELVAVRFVPVALTFAEAAVAETGTLVFASSPAAPTLFNFLALHHLAVVRADDVVPYMEDVWPRFAHHTAPRSLNLVTGTSGTADIEGQNIRGAHGPRYLHIYILDRP